MSESKQAGEKVSVAAITSQLDRAAELLASARTLADIAQRFGLDLPERQRARLARLAAGSVAAADELDAAMLGWVAASVELDSCVVASSTGSPPATPQA